MTLEDLHAQADCIVLEAVSGSHAYGLATADSDKDIRGVFIAPPHWQFGFEPPQQVQDDKSDTVFYEIGRFVDLLVKNNPTALELLHAPPDTIRKRSPIMDRLRPQMFLSKLCEQTFGGYALAQVKKARGLNKKIVNPMPEERKSVLDFCHVIVGQGTQPLSQWLAARHWRQRDCGLVALPHMRDMFGIYHDSSGDLDYHGIQQSAEAADVSVSSVPHGAQPDAWMCFNKDGFKKHCREFREYWEWVAERNEARYQTSVTAGRGYDTKNMMHTFRLLDCAEEIATRQTLAVRSRNRDFLMRIRQGEFDYEYLVSAAEEKTAHLGQLFAVSPLPDQPDRTAAEQVLIDIRNRRYSGQVLET